MCSFIDGPAPETTENRVRVCHNNNTRRVNFFDNLSVYTCIFIYFVVFVTTRDITM